MPSWALCADGGRTGYGLVFLITLLIFGVLIFVHEFGHFFAARMFKVRVNEFAIGMGPKLFSFKGKKSGTQYTLRLLPIGGYNSIEGEDGNSDESDAFCKKPVWQRLIIIVAGAIMNLVLGIIIMSIVVISTNQYASTVIHSFESEQSDAVLSEYQGLMAGDEVIKVNGTRVHIGDELVYEIMMQGANPVDLTVIRNGEEKVISGVEFPTTEQSGVVFGVRNFYVYAEQKNFVNTVKQSFYGSINSMVQVFDSLAGLIQGKYGIESVSGPIGVGEVVGQAAKIGPIYVLKLAVLLTMNLGIFNLLPIPALDGGRVVFLLIEAVRRKPLPENVEATVNGIGMIILLGLIMVIGIKDIFMIFK